MNQRMDPIKPNPKFDDLPGPFAGPVRLGTTVHGHRVELFDGFESDFVLLDGKLSKYDFVTTVAKINEIYGRKVRGGKE